MQHNCVQYCTTLLLLLALRAIVHFERYRSKDMFYGEVGVEDYLVYVEQMHPLKRIKVLWTLEQLYL